MTKEEILEMKVGDELRRKVGEDIFGYEVELRRGFYSYEDGSFVELPDARSDEFALCYVSYYMVRNNEEFLFWEELPDYPSDISAAWLVVEKLKGYYPQIEFNQYSRKWEVTFLMGETALSDVISEAICKASLLAKLGEKK